MSQSIENHPLFVGAVDGYRLATHSEVIAAARRVLSQRVRRGRPLTSPQVVREYLQLLLVDREHEVFAMLLLDQRHRHIATVELFRGTIDAAAVYPREVVKEVLRHNSPAVLFAHNHPSGVAEPSAADELITRRLVTALSMIDVRVLDHLVIGGDEVVSLADRGLM